MKRDSVLSNNEKDSIKIEKLIFHIIIQDELKPVYLDEVILEESQKNFFKKRFAEASYGNQFLFVDKDTSTVYKECESIIDDVDKNFLNASRILTALFKSHHKKTTSDGVFVIALVSVMESRKMIFLIKLDHTLVYQYKVSGAKATLEEIKNTFIEDKKAIQKVALIDMSNYYNWDLLATERNIDGIRDYFKDFLQVNEKDDRYSLTERTKSVARKWAHSNKDLLAENETSTNYRTRAINYLVGHSIFDSEEFIDHVIHDGDAERREKAKNSLREFMEVSGLYGQSFKPSEKALTPSKRKNVGKTAEGLVLQWDGNEEQVNMKIPKEKNPNDNLYHIEIRTSDINYKD